MASLDTETRMLTCIGCGKQWWEPIKRGPGRRFCDQCKKERKSQSLGLSRQVDTTSIGYRLSRENSIYCAAVRHAIGALRTGRAAEALEVLEIAASIV